MSEPGALPFGGDSLCTDPTILCLILFNGLQLKELAVDAEKSQLMLQQQILQERSKHRKLQKSLEKVRSSFYLSCLET